MSHREKTGQTHRPMPKRGGLLGVSSNTASKQSERQWKLIHPAGTHIAQCCCQVSQGKAVISLTQSFLFKLMTGSQRK